ncbi:hypothetical protein ACSBR1_028126 [Camellia fascicularis]
MNPHKWFLTNMDCCCLWVKNPSTLVDSLSTSPEILRNKATESKKVVDYKDWQIALSRRFRALKLWLVIRRKFALVCFRLKPRRSEEDGSKLNWKLLEEVNSSGKAFMTHAVVDGTFLIRCAIGGTFTEEQHIDRLWKLIQEKAADLLLFKNGCNIEE